jgi:outer membrane lipoprotein-sorting protein
MKPLILFISLFLISSNWAQIPSGKEILKKLDENWYSDNKIIVSSMKINGRRGSRTLQSKSWIQGKTKSFTEYLAPAREKGTKMLKLEDQLWTYSPSTDRTILISGHMLRQSVMGSDLSYEDMLEDQKLEEVYDANNMGEEQYNNRWCWVLQLVAKSPDVAYATRKIWVDKERSLVLKEERYAKRGKLLKTTEIKQVEQIENRWVATKIVFKDVLKRGDGTEFMVESIKFNADIPDYVFSKAALKK